MKERVDKLLAAGGLYSRSQVKKLAREGRMLINGMPALAEDKADPQADVITVDGRPVSVIKHMYIMMNKPAGVVCSTNDKQNKTVLELLPETLLRPGLFPAGRLDKDTEGFVLITDDGVLAHRILSPKMHIVKTYSVHIDAPVTPEMEAGFARGVVLADSTGCRPAGLTVLEQGEKPLLRVTLTEGIYHQVKRMFGVYGAGVIYLKRMAIGGLMLDESLAAGGCRRLEEKELEKIFAEIND